MNITLLTYGTRGDVQPFVALALGLQRAGHVVTLAAPAPFQAYVEGFGVSFAPLLGDMGAILSSPAARAWLNSPKATSFRERMKGLSKETIFRWQLAEYRAAIHQQASAACQNAHAIIAHQFLMVNEGICLAEKLRIPLIFASFFPRSPATRDFPQLLVATKSLGVLNKLSYWFFEWMFWRAHQADFRQWNDELKLWKKTPTLGMYLKKMQVATLHAYSSLLVPRPADWGALHTVTGAWVIPAEFRQAVPDADLAAWLKAGSPPIYFGLGSLPIVDRLGWVRMISDITVALGSRAILAANWEELEQVDLPERIFLLKQPVDHEWLFPQCRSILHHGGAGTTTASLRAGVPTLICSSFADQPFWGKRLVALGVGGHLPYSELDQARLLASLKVLDDPHITTCARELGLKLRAENGLEQALTVISSLLEK